MFFLLSTTWRVASLALLILSGVLFYTRQRPAADPYLVFSAGNPYHPHILYRMRPDGHNLTQLTSIHSVNLRWIDGTNQLIFMSPDGGSNSLSFYRFHLNNRAQDYLFSYSSTTISSGFAFSPDGQWFVYAERAENGEVSLYRRAVASRSPEHMALYSPQIDNGFNGIVLNSNDINPAWSPDSTQIALISYDTTDYPIYYAALHIIALDDTVTSVERIARGITFDQLLWSPDGQHIILDTFVENVFYWVDVAAGTVYEQRIEGFLGGVDWSPDGQSMVFYTTNFLGTVGKPQLYRLDPTQGQVRRLLSLSSDPLGVAWSNDGEWIAFRTSSAIYKVRSNGHDLQRIFQLKRGEEFISLDWSPIIDLPWHSGGCLLAGIIGLLLSIALPKSFSRLTLPA